MCEENATKYDKRANLRTNEDTTIAQAVAILRSDTAIVLVAKLGARQCEAVEHEARQRGVVAHAI
eukprot:2866468-Lingulodinium_polyedra.AAC.1